jgi:hypothetical protein
MHAVTQDEAMRPTNQTSAYLRSNVTEFTNWGNQFSSRKALKATHGYKQDTIISNAQRDNTVCAVQF